VNQRLCLEACVQIARYLVSLTGFLDVDVALTIVALGVRYHTSLSWQKSIFRLASCNRRLSTMKSVTHPLMPRWPGLPPTNSLPLVVSKVVSVKIFTGGFSSIWIMQAFRRRDVRIWWKTPSSTLSCDIMHNDYFWEICKVLLLCSQNRKFNCIYCIAKVWNEASHWECIKRMRVKVIQMDRKERCLLKFIIIMLIVFNNAYPAH